MAKGFEVGEDPGDGEHAGVFRTGIALATGVLFVPIQDAAHKGGDEGHPGFGTGHGLHQAEQQGEVAVDAFLFQHLRRLDPFPRGGNFDQHPLPAEAGCFIAPNDLTGLADGGLRVVTETGIHLGGHPTGHHLEDFFPEADAQLVNGFADHLLRRGCRANGLA